jgi:hypothetical protein
MRLPLQTLGVIAVTVLAARFLPVGRGPGRYVAACTLVASVLFLVPFASNLVTGARGAIASRAMWAGLSQQQADANALAVFGIPTEFVEWARARMRPGETYHVVLRVPPGSQHAGWVPYHDHWITYRMLPHLAVDSPREADRVLFYGISPRKWPRPEGRRLVVEKFTSQYALGRWQR